MIITMIASVVFWSIGMFCLLGEIPFKNRFLVGLIAFILGFSCMNLNSKKTNDFWYSKSERVVPLYEETSFSETDYVYREVDSGKYFTIEYTWWNPIKSTYRNYISEESVEKYIEVCELLNEVEEYKKILEDFLNMTVEKKFIDVDEAFETIIDFAGQAETKSAYGAYWKAAKALKKLPSVSMPTVRTGRWEQHCFEIECSVCGAEALRDSRNCYVYSKHCPSCGVKMEE